ncbi:J domain-containing protein [Spiroplasma taiwanense]|uniref:J domain-containing protein n=1 Tax=Spiroplasma taiwanense CT-1 TaxID=1276220 RepID=S5LWD2_9MOLU|nr:DnaJ domain-containing protein [Spiroplasma taiwanense]AGR40926.1 hypothetical protein STAIW_v1c02620 [Spiroplasma taiwanense CT-1]
MFIYVSLGLLLLVALIVTIVMIFKSKKTEANKLKQQLYNFKKIFQNQENKKIKLKKFEYIEVFNKFPFLSNFSETSIRLENKNIKEILLRMQGNFYNYWANTEYDFFLLFEKISNEAKVPLNQEEILKIYNVFAQESFEIFKKTFISEVMPALICKSQNKVYKSFNENEINNFVDSQFLFFCKEIDNLFKKIEEDIIFEDNKKSSSNNQYFKKETNLSINNAYKILGLKPSDSDEKVKKTYRKLAKEFHPDRNKNESAKKKMAEINDAYDKVISDRTKNRKG